MRQTIALSPTLKVIGQPVTDDEWEAKLYYPANLEHLTELLAALSLPEATDVIIVVIVDALVVERSAVEAMGRAAGRLGRKSTASAILVAIQDANDALEAFQMALKETGYAGPDGGNAAESLDYVSWNKGVAEYLMQLLAAGREDSTKVVVVFHSEAKGLTPLSVMNVLPTLRKSDFCITIECRLSLFDRSDTVRLSDLWRVQLAGRSTALPIWRDYDHIEHFLSYGWEDFDSRQSEAANKILELLSDYSITEVHDIGCGSGEILNSMRAAWEKNVSYYGYDPSPRQVYRAQRLLGSGVELSCCSIEEVRIQSPACSVALLLGNTLAHIGSESFWSWLTKGAGQRPEYLVIDFAVDWSELLMQGEPEIICGPLRRIESAGGGLYCHMTTAGGPGWVKRGVVLQFDEVGNESERAPNGASSSEHRLFTKQWADPPQTYFNILRARGYQGEWCGRYWSGWGEHDLYLFQRVQQKASFPWPSVMPSADYVINNRLYDLLRRGWQRLDQPTVAFEHEIFPAAVLALGGGQVLARYVPRTPEEETGDLDSLFEAWMWVVDPRRETLKHEGAPKSETILPYAPSLFKVLLADAPGSVIEPFDRTRKELRIDSNAADIELSYLERKWLTRTANKVPDLYYAVPLYLHGLPAYVVILRAGDLVNDSSDVNGYLRQVRLKIEESLAGVLDEWERLATSLVEEDGLDVKFVASALERVGAQPWRSWLDLRPGLVMHKDHAEVSSQFLKLKERHRSCMNAVAEGSERTGGFTNQGEVMSPRYDFRHATIKQLITDSENVNTVIAAEGFGDVFLGALTALRQHAEERQLEEVKTTVEMAEVEAKKGNPKRAIQILRGGGELLLEAAKSAGVSLVVELVKSFGS